MHIVVPVKRFDRAKQRLAGYLAPAQRAALSRAMLLDLLDASRDLSGIEGIVVVTDEESLASWRRRFDIEPVTPVATGLNQAVSGALAMLAARGARRALVLHSDLPFAKTGELQSLVDESAEFALVPDRHGQGTNAMVLSCIRPPRLAFGPGSLALHAAAARAQGLEATLCPMPSLALDIDTVADVNALLAADPKGRHRSSALLQRWALRGLMRPAADSAVGGTSWGSGRSIGGTPA